MPADERKKWQTIMDRENLSTNPQCPGCGRQFNLGDPVVYSCGAWGETPKLIHETDAVFDAKKKMYVERRCYEAGRGM
ncbi:MAG: hypothetical protein C4530_13655 [Desulfobacteraceae bacterium]|nr:MAG: hypothetical protein C4530_13655 [Desulfobacteraceae bacterium]